MNILNRTSNNINLATFWENYNLQKYNFDPDYQREGDVWSESDKSYLIDTIMKNFPMPPIFLHQHIDDDTGKTIYDVIDGKQRLSAIIDFLKNNICIPEDFSNDGFGTPELEEARFEDLSRPEFAIWKKNLWKYEITIEYVETDDQEVVNHIFDRLNRNGEALTNQELRKAKYGNTYFYKSISELSELNCFVNFVKHLKSNRLEHHEFISELFFLVSEGKVIAGDRPTEIDKYYDQYSIKNDQEIDALVDKFKATARQFEEFHLRFDDKKLLGVSHIYGLFGLAWKLETENIEIENLPEKLSNFYKSYKVKNTTEQIIEEYRVTMSAGTKGASRRRSRIDTLYRYISQ